MRSTLQSKSQSVQSKLETIKVEGNATLIAKKERIQELNKLIDNAETELAKLRADICTQARQFSTSQSKVTINPEEDDQEILDLITENEDEIEQTSLRFQEEIESLKEEYLKRLKTAERWADEHISTIVHEKEIELEQLREDLRNAKIEGQSIIDQAANNASKLQAKSKIAAQSHENRIKSLEQQIAALTATTREEVRDVRHKINETVNTMGVRKQEHENELLRYKQEYDRREKLYNEQVSAMEEQFKLEKSNLELAIKAATENAQNAIRMKKKLDKFHDKQVKITKNDNMRLKNILATTSERDEAKFQETLSQATNPYIYRQQCEQLKRELQMVNDETIELRRDNDRLLEVLNRINNNLYGQE